MTAMGHMIEPEVIIEGLMARIGQLEAIIEAMRCAGGSVEFQAAFDQAKELIGKKP